MTLLKTVLVVLVIMASATSRAVAEEEDIVLRIGGAAATDFSAECELKTEGGSERFQLDQSVPFEAIYVGTRLSCRVTASSMIDIEVAKGGSISRIRISGGVARVNVGS